MCRHDFQIAAPGLTITSSGVVFPIRYRISLECRLSSGRALRGTEEKTARLSPGFSVDFQDGIIFPTDSNPSRHTHDRGSAIGSTLFAGRLVFCRIPSVSHLTSFRGNGDGFVIAFFRGDHANAPV